MRRRFEKGEIVQHRAGKGKVLDVDRTPGEASILYLEWIEEFGFTSWVLEIECRALPPLVQLAEQAE